MRIALLTVVARRRRRPRDIGGTDGRLRRPSGGDRLTVTEAPFLPPEPFRCESGSDGATMWVRPIGELDLDTAQLLDEELAAARATGSAGLVLDLRRLTFMDSTGLRLVIRWDTAAREEGFEFAIVPGQDAVQRVLRLTGMDQHLTLAEPPSGP
jgi:anti-sigma B factor antagonist